MDFSRLENLIKNEPEFIRKEAWRYIFVNLLESWKDARYIPSPLRKKLEKECPLEIKGQMSLSNDKKTAKALIFLNDNKAVESVLMLSADRATVCVSSQVGCPMGCKFCATGKMGFIRNLTIEEIISQVLFFARYLSSHGLNKGGLPIKRISNVVFMGMGEPFLNYDNVMSAIKILNDKNGLNIGARHISISTSGLIPEIEKFSNEPLQLNLAISLHAPNNELRSSLMPVNNKYPLPKLMEAVKKYTEKTKRKVMFEYLLIDGINDTEKCAHELISLMKNNLYMVNLIPYNATGVYKESSPEKIKQFKKILQDNGIETTQRVRFGREIDAACGQLAGKSNKA